jgi:hypothetical protein
MREVGRDLFEFNNLTARRQDLLFYGAVTSAIGAVNQTVLQWQTNGGARGGMSWFMVDFNGIIPAPSQFAARLYFNSSLVPLTGPGAVLDLSQFIGEKINYFLPFDGSGVHVFRFVLDNLAGIALYPRVTISGFYV